MTAMFLAAGTRRTALCCNRPKGPFIYRRLSRSMERGRPLRGGLTDGGVSGSVWVGSWCLPIVGARPVDRCTPIFTAS